VFDEYPAGFFLNPKKKNEHAALTRHCDANARTLYAVDVKQKCTHAVGRTMQLFLF